MTLDDSAEVDLITNGQKEKMLAEDNLTAVEGGGFAIDFGGNKGCPSLKDYKCLIHKNKLRPKTCGDFPLFIWENKVIRLSQRCPAVRHNMFYPYIVKLKKLGYTLSYSEEKYERISIKRDLKK